LNHTPASFYLGLALLGVYAAHVYDKRRRDIVPELLWACNVNNLLMSLGLILDLYWLTAISFMFQIGVGLPAYTFEILGKREAYERSIVMHIAPALFGYVALQRVGLPPYLGLITFLIMIVGLLLVSYYFTKPELNVNVVHAPWELCQRYFSSRMRLYRVMNAFICLLSLLTAELLCNHWLFAK
jgi:hypothetical protein